MFLSQRLLMPYMKKQTQVIVVLNITLIRYYVISSWISVDIEDSDGEEQWHWRGHDHPQQDHGAGGPHQAVEADQDIREAHLGERKYLLKWILEHETPWAIIYSLLSDFYAPSSFLFMLIAKVTQRITQWRLLRCLN